MKQKITPILPPDAAKRLSTHAENVLNFVLELKDEDYIQVFKDIYEWHKWHDVSLTDTLKNRWAAFSKLMGFEPQFIFRNEVLNACWALDYNGIFLFIYISNNGLNLEIDHWTNEDVEDKHFKITQVLTILHEMVGPNEEGS